MTKAVVRWLGVGLLGVVVAACAAAPPSNGDDESIKAPARSKSSGTDAVDESGDTLTPPTSPAMPWRPRPPTARTTPATTDETEDADTEGTEATPAAAAVTPRSCKEAMTPATPSGVYLIDPDGPGGAPAFQVFCDMSTDGGGWILMAGLSTVNTAPVLTAYDAWSDDWWTIQHRDPTDPTNLFANHDVRKFRPLVTPTMLLRMTTTASATRRFHFGMTPEDWDLWNAGRDIMQCGPWGAVRTVGPFNVDHVMVSTKLDLTSPAIARMNGWWKVDTTYPSSVWQGNLLWGSMPCDGDNDGEGLGARFDVGTVTPGQFGFAGDVRAETTIQLWIRG